MTARSLDEAIEESHAALGAISNGDVEPFMALYSDGDDVTVGNPFGPFVRGREAVRGAGERAASRYRDGQVVGFERVATHVAGGLACVAEVERFRAKVGGSDSPASVGLRVDGQVSAPWGRGEMAPRRDLRLGDMTIQRIDNVAIVVEDLDAAVALFTELGMELEGKAQIEGLFADRIVGLDGVRSDIAMMRTPDGHSRLELTKYHAPAAAGAEQKNPPPNTPGLHRVMFAVDDIHDTVARLRAHGAELLGEVAQYENIYLLCYLRGPAGIIVALAEQIG